MLIGVEYYCEYTFGRCCVNTLPRDQLATYLIGAVEEIFEVLYCNSALNPSLHVGSSTINNTGDNNMEYSQYIILYVHYFYLKPQPSTLRVFLRHKKLTTLPFNSQKWDSSFKIFLKIGICM